MVVAESRWEARDAAEHTKMTRTTPIAENYPAPVLPRLNNFDTDQTPFASSELSTVNLSSTYTSRPRLPSWQNQELKQYSANTKAAFLPHHAASHCHQTRVIFSPWHTEGAENCKFYFQSQNALNTCSHDTSFLRLGEVEHNMPQIGIFIYLVLNRASELFWESRYLKLNIF